MLSVAIANDAGGMLEAQPPNNVLSPRQARIGTAGIFQDHTQSPRPHHHPSLITHDLPRMFAVAGAVAGAVTRDN